MAMPGLPDNYCPQSHASWPHLSLCLFVSLADPYPWQGCSGAFLILPALRVVRRRVEGHLPLHTVPP